MADTELIAPFDAINRRVPEGAIWKYEIVLRGGRLTHTWALIGKDHAVHIHANRSSDIGWGREWFGGIETHWSSAPDYMSAEKPSHEHCWLLGKPCWHDGTSLGFSENVAPYLPRDHEKLTDSHHDLVTCELSRWFRQSQVEAGDAA